ncbi:SDR family NAD(P)-dependent oxidoreductase [Brackiella oedipodis]|uniref:SDR family NAD(P)-dependent oxidoreductase n=1 Tax=Brackiella oedipodis TaxID=124225 RepID=UPI0009FC2FB2|nr:SDR family NAD(P)-dependent oxidoreductase [Brackiella oedipodis]
MESQKQQAQNNHPKTTAAAAKPQLTETKYDLSGKVALVTGGTGGMGRDFAAYLAESGANVVLTARRPDALKNIVEQVNQANAKTPGAGKVIAVALNVLDEDNIKQAFDEAEKAFGTVNILVNNAGVSLHKRATDITLQEWNKVIATNMTACWAVAKEAAKRLIAAGQGGSIVNISSILGHRVGAGLLAYCAAKGGLEQITKGLALEWARFKIRVNAIAPSYIETPMIAEQLAQPEIEQAILKRLPLRRVGNTHDLRAPLLMLLSDDSAFITGVTVPVDGGHMLFSLT